MEAFVPETEAGYGRQTADSTLQEAGNVACLIQASGFEAVEAVDIQEIIGYCQPEPTTQEILHEEKEEPAEEEQPVEVLQGPSMQLLSVVLTELTRLTQLVAEYDKEAWHSGHHLPVAETIIRPQQRHL